jgi:hypothetical protein
MVINKYFITGIFLLLFINSVNSQIPKINIPTPTTTTTTGYNDTYNNLLNQDCPNGYVVNGTYLNGTFKCTPVTNATTVWILDQTNKNLYTINSGFVSDVGNSNNIIAGENAGYNSTTSIHSIFFGYQSGYNSIAENSIFLGNQAGYESNESSYSNFFGNNVGYNSYNAHDSNFFGRYSGAYAVNSSFSNFFGYFAGYGQNNASYSIFIGTNAGNNNLLNNKTDFTRNLIIDQSRLENGRRLTKDEIINNALLYGTFAETSQDQQLTINGLLNIGKADGSGVAYYMPRNSGLNNTYLKSYGNGTTEWANVTDTGFQIFLLNKILYYDGGNRSINWGVGELYDTSDRISIDYGEERKLYASNGVAVLDYEGHILFNNNTGVAINFKDEGKISVNENNITMITYLCDNTNKCYNLTQMNDSISSTFNATYNNILNQDCPNGYVVNGTYINGTFKCTLISSSGNPFDQSLNTTNKVRFNEVNATTIRTNYLDFNSSGFIRAGSTNVISPFDTLILDKNGYKSINWSGRHLLANGSGTDQIAVTWGYNQRSGFAGFLGEGNNISISTYSRILFDMAGNDSIDYRNRVLTNQSETILLKWDNDVGLWDGTYKSLDWVLRLFKNRNNVLVMNYTDTIKVYTNITIEDTTNKSRICYNKDCSAFIQWNGTTLITKVN